MPPVAETLDFRASGTRDISRQLRSSPSSCTFKQSIERHGDEQSVQVMNVGKLSSTIIVLLPDSDVFRVRCEPPPAEKVHTSFSLPSLERQDVEFVAGSNSIAYIKIVQSSNPDLRGPWKLAPGMSITLITELAHEVQKDISSEVIVTCIDDNSVLRVPLVAHRAVAIVSTDVEVIDLGHIVADGRQYTASFKIRNRGGLQSQFEVTADPNNKPGFDSLNEPGSVLSLRMPGGPPLKTGTGMPPVGTTLDVLGTPGSVQELFIGFSTDKPVGTVDALLNITLDGGLPPLKVRIVCTAGTQRMLLLPATHRNQTGKTGQELEQSSFDLGMVYFQTERSTSAVLYNEGGEPLDFAVLLNGQETHTYAIGGSKQADTAGEALAVQIEPSEGKLAPYEKKTIKFTFAPDSMVPVKGWARGKTLPPRKDYKISLVVVGVGSDQRAPFTLTGSGLLPNFLVDRTNIVFTEGIPVTRSLSQQMTLTNSSTHLPLSVEADPVAHFSLKPKAALLLPGESQKFEVAFKPRQIGSLARETTLRLAEGTVQVKVKLRGECTGDAASMQRSRKFGLTTISSQLAAPDLLAPFRFGLTQVTSMKAQYISGPDGRQHHGMNATCNPGTTLKPIKPYETPYIAQDPTYQHDKIGRFLKASNTQQYNRYVREQGETRRAQMTAARRSNPKTKDFQGAAGKAPAPTLDEIERSPCLATALVTREIEELKLQREYGDVTQRLSPYQLGQISLISSHRIDFGDVCIGSENAVFLEFENLLDRDVAVTFEVPKESPELKSAGGQAYLLRRRDWNEGPDEINRNRHRIKLEMINITEETPPVYNTTLTYKFNGIHSARITVVARVVAATLELSATEVTIPVGRSARCPRDFNTVTLSNPLSNDVEFSWRLQDESASRYYFITPSRGRVGPHETLDCVVELQSAYTMPKSAVMLLSVADGASTSTLLCCAETAGTKCKPESQRIEFGTIGVKTPTTKTCTVKNIGAVDAYFEVGNVKMRPEKENPQVIVPSSGIIRAGAELEFSVTFTPQTVRKWEGEFNININGAPPLKVMIGGKSDSSEIDFVAPQFNFKGVAIGQRQKVDFTVSNLSKSMALVTFDTSCSRDFSFYFPADPVSGKLEEKLNEHSPHVSTKTESIERVAESDIPKIEFKTGVNKVKNALNMTAAFDRVSKEAAERTDFEAAEGRAKLASEAEAMRSVLVPVATEFELYDAPRSKGVMYSLSLDPGETRSLFMDFSPTEVAAYDFQMAVGVNGDPRTSKRVRATGLRPNLQMSLTSINFGRVFLGAHPVTGEMANSLQSLTLTWLGSDPESVFFGDEFGPAFHATMATGDEIDNGIILQPHVPRIVTFRFTPADVDLYEVSLPVYLGKPEGTLYSNLGLKGWGTKPYISFSTAVAELPPVPLGVESSLTIFTRSSGYGDEDIDVNYRLPSDKKRCPVLLSFPKGKRFPKDEQSLPIVLTFRAENSLCFDVTLEVFDRYDVIFPLRVTGKADMSLFSIYPYVAANPSHYPVKSSGLGRSETAYVGAIKYTLSRWLSSFGLQYLKPIDVPVGLSNDGARLAFDVIKYLNGTDVPGIKLVRPPSTDYVYMLEALSLTIEFLTGKGALLSDVRPELLLCEEHFRDWFRSERLKLVASKTLHRDAGQLWLQTYESIDANFEALSSRAWTTLGTQLIRLFVFPRITEQSLASRFAGYPPPATPDAASSRSHSPEELRLLKWLSFHTQRLSNTTKSVTNFGDDLADGTVFASLIASHMPWLAPDFFSDLYSDANTLDRRRHNASRVVAAIRTLHLAGLDLDWADIAQPQPCWMMLVVAQLYEVLPQFAPHTNTNVIVFNGMLQEVIRRDVAIENMAIRTATYRSWLIGDKVFSLPSPSLVIPPGKTKGLGVCCAPKTNVGAEAMLYVVGSVSGSSEMVVLVFKLVSEVTPVTGEPVVHVTSSCYATRTMMVPVTNTFETDATFSINFSELDHKDAEAAAERAARGRKVLSGHSGSPSKKSLTVHRDVEKSYPRKSMWAEQSEVSLKAGETRKLKCCFCPTRLGEHRGALVLDNEQLGQVQTVVTGLASLPEPVAYFEFDGRSMMYNVTVPYNNRLKQQALESIPDGMEPEVTHTLTITSKNGKLISKELNLRCRIASIADRDSQPFKCGKRLVLRPGSASATGTIFAPHITTAALVHEKLSTDFQLKFDPIGGGQYGCDIIFEGFDDIRVYRVIIDLVEDQPTFSTVAIRPTEALVWNGIVARQRSYRSFMITNEEETEEEFEIRSTLPEWATVESRTIIVPALSTEEFIMEVFPKLSGDHIGTVSFVSPRQYQNFDVTVKVLKPEATGTIELGAGPGASVECTVQLNNPLHDTPIVFEVEFSNAGRGNFFGEEKIDVAPGTVAPYTFLFENDCSVKNPEEPFATVTFSSVVAGEFWYQLKKDKAE